MPSVAERIDPTSPHYDKTFAELRKKAFKAHEDHEKDMKEDPHYKKEFNNLLKKGKLK